VLPQYLNALSSFFAYFGVAIAMIAVFLLIYINVTPYAEIALIREGNTAAAISLSGALLGFVMPVANAIAHNDTLAGLMAWGAVAGVVQILAYLAARYAFPKMNSDIPEGRVAPAIFLAVLSLSIGIINAACMSY
jgi:putative membrane protein